MFLIFWKMLGAGAELPFDLHICFKEAWKAEGYNLIYSLNFRISTLF